MYLNRKVFTSLYNKSPHRHTPHRHQPYRHLGIRTSAISNIPKSNTSIPRFTDKKRGLLFKIQQQASRNTTTITIFNSAGIVLTCYLLSMLYLFVFVTYAGLATSSKQTPSNVNKNTPIPISCHATLPTPFTPPYQSIQEYL